MSQGSGALVMHPEEKITPSGPSNSFSSCKIVGWFGFLFEVYVLRTKISFLSVKKIISLFYLGHLISLNGCLLLHDLQMDVITKL